MDLSPPCKGWETAVQNPDTDFDSVWEGFAGSETEKKDCKHITAAQ